MRMLCAIGLGVALLTTASSINAETTFPYQATIDGSDVYVRSGPGKNYYPTDKLQRGTVVEVYRHDPGGWSAIRPPEDSFSWIAGEHLRLGDDDIAEVISDKVVAYVGSRFRDVHDVRQVQLDRGEAVQVVGEKRFTEEGENIAQTWYKVMPPAGEFRWVYGKLLLKQQETDTVARNAGRDSESHEPTPIEAPATAVANQEPTPIDLAPEADSGGDDEVSLASYDDGLEGDDGPAAVRKNGAKPARLQRTAGGEAPVRIVSDGKTSVPAKATTRRRTADDLDVELSLIIAEEPDTWEFHELTVRAERTIVEAESALLRGRARRVLREIARYEKIQSEYFEAAEIREETERLNESIESSVIQASAEEEVQTQATTSRDRFDGVGRLTPVRSKRTGAPPFALTDGEGRVLMFVTPAPGVNLRGYVGKRVGLVGTRGRLPKLKADHLTAKRAELVDDTETE